MTVGELNPLLPREREEMADRIAQFTAAALAALVTAHEHDEDYSAEDMVDRAAELGRMAWQSYVFALRHERRKATP
ncbi:MAG TPA: hypothetical protein VF841_17320 [Anaeromyxobacter sp.]